MVDALTIHGLTAMCRLGVLDAEQANPQEIRIDVALAIDAKRAASRDDVDDAVDYARLVTAVKQFVERTPYRLMETMAEEIAALILKEFRTPEVTVKVTKRALPEIESAAVELTRHAGTSRKSGGFPRGARRLRESPSAVPDRK